jgi:methylenetetrahydrofolate dehydrogenase (NADP+) / methenyltetrahydrofolate cyclohydrolase
MILDGKTLSESLKDTLKADVATFASRFGRAPGLHVILVGADPASQVYTRNKERTALALGIQGHLHALPADTTEADLFRLIDRLNADDSVDGILIQLPLPKHLTLDGGESRILWRVDAAKDVDGFHPINAGRLALGQPAIVPATPKGAMLLLKMSGIALSGLHAVVVGRSNIVGKPMAQLLLSADATVTLAHSKTKNLKALCQSADILVAAIGRPEMFTAEYLKPGVIVIDVGINRLLVESADEKTGIELTASASRKSRLVGDVHYASAVAVAKAITPVPGGVGPMTIACLMQNTLEAATARRLAKLG